MEARVEPVAGLDLARERCLLLCELVELWSCLMLSDWLVGYELAAGGGKDEGKTPASIIKAILLTLNPC